MPELKALDLLRFGSSGYTARSRTPNPGHTRSAVASERVYFEARAQRVTISSYEYRQKHRWRRRRTVPGAACQAAWVDVERARVRR